MTAEQAGFERREDGARDPRRCGTCWHFCMFPAKVRAKEQAGACEIVRPDDDNLSVNPGDYCHWWTEDGIGFPLRDGEEEPEADEEPKPESSED
jgi:hypothetical protein